MAVRCAASNCQRPSRPIQMSSTRSRAAAVAATDCTIAISPSNWTSGSSGAIGMAAGPPQRAMNSVRV